MMFFRNWVVRPDREACRAALPNSDSHSKLGWAVTAIKPLSSVYCAHDRLPLHMPQTVAAEEHGHLREVATLFLRLGFTTFGGPAAHIAMMREEVVQRRGWVSEERFLDLLGVANLIPGPTSTELAIYLGYLRAGWLGLLLAGMCFI